MIVVTPPAAINGDCLDAELRAAGIVDAHVILTDEGLVVEPAEESDRTVVEKVVAAHVPPPPPPTVSEQLAAATTADAKVAILIQALGL